MTDDGDGHLYHLNNQCFNKNTNNDIGLSMNKNIKS